MQKSTSGMNPIDGKSKNMEETTKKQKIYSANEICNIIKTCSKNGVTNIKISGIEVNFKAQGTELPESGMIWPSPKVSNKKADTTPLKPLELTDVEKEELEDLELAQQAIDDPILFEQEMIKTFIDGEVDEANGYS